MPPPVRPEVSREEFKKWLFDKVDSNKDGQISKSELSRALKELGHSFSWLKAFWAIWVLDSNRNGAIDTDSEIDQLSIYAQHMWGFKVTN